MSGSWWVWVLALWGSLVTGAQGMFYEEPLLICGDEDLEYTLQLLPTNISTRLSVYDLDGNGTPLITDESCGIWVTPDFDGNVVIYAQYDGCYIQKMENNYTMTIFLEVNTTGEWEVYQKEDLMCPISQPLTFGVKDSPSPSECSGVPRENRLACGGPQVSQEVCLQNGCCFDQADPRTPCYYGNRVTAQCTRDGMLSVAVSSGVTLPSLILPSVKFPRASGTACGPIAQNNAFILFSFPLSACGTTQTVDGTNVVYENDLVGDKEVRTWGGSSITRDSTFRLHIRCSFIQSDLTQLTVEVYTLPPPPPASSFGPLSFEMRIAQDDQYQKYYIDADYPIIKVLRDPIFVEVRILNRRDAAVVLMLDHCWGTATADPQRLPQWPILVDGCPFEGDNYKTLMRSVYDEALEFPLHYKRFIVSTFAFEEFGQTSLSGLVYFHCSVSACVQSPQDQCMTRCPTRRRRAVNRFDEVTVSAHGPIVFDMKQKELFSRGVEETGHHLRLDWVWAVLAGSVFGIAIVTVWLKKRNVYKIKNINI
ncbi:zona pellucida sperm-binding protein 4-like [Engystomops pustulosus]|uniref:zona pellucida sperm-binding protein 4-like n=1 Tax=Engystomops pustulosus TaxID=76066 RepID=UPI003AFA81A0